jgi:L-iditol 2-dehydrogenase/galactitol-1-phosphate 5-dehydrogenase
VFGAGVIGNLAIQTLRAHGVTHISAVDIHPGRLGLASRHGASATFNSSSGTVEDFLATEGRPTVVVETSGNSAVQAQCVAIADKDGQVVYIGTAHGDVPLSETTFERILRGELVITGSWMSYSDPFPGSEWATAVTMIDSGSVEVESLISRIYTLEDRAQPFLDLTAPGSTMAKVLYHVNEDL